MTLRHGLVGILILLAGPTASVRGEAPREEVPAALAEYASRPEPAYGWKRLKSDDVPGGRIHDLELTSQTWKGITWTHALRICEPAEVRDTKHVLLFVTGGRTGQPPRKGETDMALALAGMTGARVAVLCHVPNQPLLGDRVEDDLITETWLKFLETGESDWPLLLPMVKSAVKAMDAVGEFGTSEWGAAPEGYVVTGASKRGWTTWLSAAADRRVRGIAPLVIDTLNFRAQTRHQLATWGRYSEQIDDYTRKGLVNPDGQEETPRETELRVMMDPYTYRSKFGLPKLMVNGANDRYWVIDALNNYWDDLPGEKHVLYVPNAGHDLKGGEGRVLPTVAAFFRAVTAGEELPRLTWRHGGGEGRLTLEVESSVPAKAGRLWVAHSPTKDFREARWEERALAEGEAGVFRGAVMRPAEGHVALYGELEFEVDGLPLFLSTQVQVE